MAEVKLDLNPLEVRGLWMLRNNVIEAQKAADMAVKSLDAYKAQAAEALKGKVPRGVTVVQIRIDEQKGEAWIPATEEPKPGAPTPKARAGK